MDTDNKNTADSFEEKNKDFKGVPRSSGGYHRTLWLIGGCMSFILLLFEVWATKHYGVSKADDCSLMLMPCIFCFFSLTVHSTLTIKCAPLLRKLSTIIFFSHFLWLFGAELAEWALKITIPYAGKFLVAIVGSLLTACLILRFEKVKHFHWLGYFY